MKLDDAQLSAVFHNSGPALVVAGPGSGKTTVILNRVLYLIQQCQIPPEQILVLTFTRAAAQSLQSRFLFLAEDIVLPVTFGTFHSIFYQILRQYGSYKNSKIITTTEKYNILYDLGVKDKTLLGDICHAFGYLLGNPNAQIQSVLPAQMSEEEFQQLFQAYVRQLKLEDMLDFDQMAELVLQLFLDKPSILVSFQTKYHYFLVDEFQDTNFYQYEILKLISSKSSEIFVVGDDDQAIYSFRGSSPSIMMQFQEDFDDVKSYFLTTNYRSGSRIVMDANRLIRANQQRIAKRIRSANTQDGSVSYLDFETKEMEYDYIVKRIKNLLDKIKPEEIAVIGRTNRQIDQLRQVLFKEGVACQSSGTKEEKKYSIVTEHLMGLIKYILGDKSKAKYWRSIYSSLDGYSPLFWADKHAKLFMNHLLKCKEYKAFLQGLGEDKEFIKKELSILVKESGRHKSLQSFLEMLMYRVEESKQSSEGIHLLTMHSSKGLEFEYVCLIDINEGIIPGKQCITPMEIEEERRMLYVGMTRAKKILDVCYLKGTKEHPRLASRFLNPLLGREKKD
ncbi:MAG: ATP-dependent helicase [Lachnospiraceae bacterium]|nr:ATP-dependent helicase [Lachnospiraceae bacterium]